MVDDVVVPAVGEVVLVLHGGDRHDPGGWVGAGGGVGGVGSAGGGWRCGAGARRGRPRGAAGGWGGSGRGGGGRGGTAVAGATSRHCVGACSSSTQQLAPPREGPARYL